MKKPQSAIEDLAISIISTEKSNWETGTAFITDKVAFQMRNLIRTLRKNYWGVFDELKDPITQRNKIWQHLTKEFVEAVVKNIDIDTKDINFRAKNVEAIRLTSLVRSITKNNLDEMSFGEDLDMLTRQLAIDGTVVWKTFEEKEGGRTRLRIRQVDLLNFYIDPTAPCIQDDSVAIIERAIMTPEDAKKIPGIINKDKIVGGLSTDRYDGERNTGANSGQQGTVKLVAMYERWGPMPKFLITGEEKDMEVTVNGRILASGDANNNFTVHLIETYDGYKPYEECWYTRVPGRWYGEGIAEKLMWYQIWKNSVANLRINRAFVSQLGIFKIKKGAGITPQILSRLVSNGAVPVTGMDDIQQMPVADVPVSSYKDDEVIHQASQRVTSAFDAATGEDMPSSMPATNAAIQSRASQSQFVLVKEYIGLFLQRWLKRHAMPIIMKNVKNGDVVRMGLEPTELRELDENYVNYLAAQELNKYKNMGIWIDPAMVERDIITAQEKLARYGRDRYVKMMKNIDVTEFDVQVYVTNEEIDKGVLSQNLLTMLQAAPEYKEEILQTLNDVMGIPPFTKPKVLDQAQLAGAPQGMPEIPSQNPTNVFTQGNII